MKEDLSIKEITRCIGNGFEVYMEYRVDWVAKYRKMGEKHTFWAIFGDMYRHTLNLYRYSLGYGHFWPTCTDGPVQVRLVPVHPALFRLVFVF